MFILRLALIAILIHTVRLVAVDFDIYVVGCKLWRCFYAAVRGLTPPFSVIYSEPFVTGLFIVRVYGGLMLENEGAALAPV